MKNINNIENNNTDALQENDAMKLDDDLLVFVNHKSDLMGTLKGNVKFAQSQIIPYRPELTDIQPYLTSLRRTLLLVRPTTFIKELSVIIKDREGVTISSLDLNNPDSLPKLSIILQRVTKKFTPSARMMS